MRIFDEQTNNQIVGILEDVPTSVIHHSGKPSEWLYIGNKGIKIDLPSGCLHCRDPKCYQFENRQISSDILEFSYDRTRHVCPVNAIKWDHINNQPIIDDCKCLRCGICARMCPAGAIYFNGSKMELSSSDLVKIKNATPANCSVQKKQLAKIRQAYHAGIIIKESDSILEKIYENLNNLSGNTPNLVARSLLIALGNRCAISRVGDVYTRLDALLEDKYSKVSVVEVEFGRDTLEAARGILDDIAVANCRYKINKTELMSLVVCLQLPNERQGYWQVIKDIHKVENIRINTVTIGGLLLLMWNLLPFDITDSAFYVDFDNMSIRKTIDYLLDSDTTVCVSHRKLGILEPEK